MKLIRLNKILFYSMFFTLCFGARSYAIAPSPRPSFQFIDIFMGNEQPNETSFEINLSERNLVIRDLQGAGEMKIENVENEKKYFVRAELPLNLLSVSDKKLAGFLEGNTSRLLFNFHPVGEILEKTYVELNGSQVKELFNGVASKKIVVRGVLRYELGVAYKRTIFVIKDNGTGEGLLKLDGCQKMVVDSVSVRSLEDRRLENFPYRYAPVWFNDFMRTAYRGETTEPLSLDRCLTVD